MSNDEKMFVIENQQVIIETEINGERILDIGGGGEGIIGLCYEKRVIAIDARKDELEEAPDGPLKIVMDARELSFLENSFDAVTSFFTLMYINKIDHEKVFNEVYRVLKKDGEFFLWDTVIPKKDGEIEDIFVIQLEIKTPIKQIKTGYGVLRKEQEQDLGYFISLGEKVGFKVIKREKEDQVFKIIFRK